jgi:hypothetical protein
MTVTRKTFENLNNEQFLKLCRKGVFPYSWFDDTEKLEYTHLPSPLDFYDQLSNKYINYEDYNHA